jgi:hypothetical protein
VQQAVPVLAGMVSTAAQPVLLGVIKLLGALASTHAEGRLQVHCCWVSTGAGKRSWVYGHHVPDVLGMRAVHLVTVRSA